MRPAPGVTPRATAARADLGAERVDDRETSGKQRTSRKPGDQRRGRSKPRPPARGGGKRPGKPQPSTPQAGPAGLLARELAVDIVHGVLVKANAMDDVMARGLEASRYASLEARDRALARSIAASSLRYARPLQSAVAGFLDKPLPEKYAHVGIVLLCAAAQLACLKSPPHAVISLAVDQVRRVRNANHLAGLANAVLRKLAGSLEAPEALAAATDPVAAFPRWMLDRWRASYGAALADRMARVTLVTPALDLTLKPGENAEHWAGELGATRLTTGSLRLANAGRIDELPGFADGRWWVQDAAASLPARLLGDVASARVADLCAAPGGKTAELAAAGAAVTAVDVSEARLRRVAENLKRLNLSADLVAEDAVTWAPPELFDAVLLDAPCTATGTIRRHPDILHLKRRDDVANLADLQSRLLANAAAMVRPGGLLVYCTCSLEPEEGERQIEAFLARAPEFRRVPVRPGEAGIAADWITADGDLRTLPCHSPIETEGAVGRDDPTMQPSEESGATTSDVAPAPVPDGMDGFYAVRLIRSN